MDGIWNGRAACVRRWIIRRCKTDSSFTSTIFIVTDEGDWAVVQQGMNPAVRAARRYHWSSARLRSFVENPHSGVVGENRGEILNLTDLGAAPTRSSILSLSRENPDRVLHEISQMVNPSTSIVVPEQFDLFDSKPEPIEICHSRDLRMPSHHDVRMEDVNLKRLGGVLATAYESNPNDFESLLLTLDWGRVHCNR